MIGDEKGNLLKFCISKVFEEFEVPKGPNIPTTLNSFNPKRKYFQNSASLFHALLKE